MNSVNKTLYIPLYGKAYVSKRGLFIDDKWAEQIWDDEGFNLKGKSASKWLAFYMGIRAAVFDEWVRNKMSLEEDAVIIHIGCGLDSRHLRIGISDRKWYDVDFPDVITERKRHYCESGNYRMIPGDVRQSTWISEIPENKSAIVIMEGVSMYMSEVEVRGLFADLGNHFEHISVLMDCYSAFAAKASKYKNPINDVGVTQVYGIDDPTVVQGSGIIFLKEHEMTPEKYIDSLGGFEKYIFRRLYAGKFAKMLYRLFEYGKI